MRLNDCGPGVCVSNHVCARRMRGAIFNHQLPGNRHHSRIAWDQHGSHWDRITEKDYLTSKHPWLRNGQPFFWIHVLHMPILPPGTSDALALSVVYAKQRLLLSLSRTGVGPVAQLLFRATTRNTVTPCAYNCGMRSIPFVDAQLFIRDRKTVPHCDLAGLALSAVHLLPPVHQTKSTLSFAPSSAFGTRRDVRDPCGIEESEEFREEGLQRWDGQSNQS